MSGVTLFKGNECNVMSNERVGRILWSGVVSWMIARPVVEY